MGKERLNTTEIRDQIDMHMTHILTWTTILDALDQQTPEILQIPSYTMGEVARSIQTSALKTQELVDLIKSD